MSRKLRIERLAGLQRLARAREVGNVRVHLAGEYRIALQSQLLRVFYFRVPVRAFHEPHRYPAADIPAQALQETENIARPALVGLHGQSEAVVPGQAGVAEYPLENLQR